MGLRRRDVIIGGASALAATGVSGSAIAVLAPRMACGCVSVHEKKYGHTCTIHDDKGRRWDSYTAEEIAAEYGAKLEVQTEKTEWSCYCGRHDDQPDNQMPVGTKCIWEKTSYEYDEWECRCADSLRDDWLNVQTTDWIAEAKADGLT